MEEYFKRIENDLDEALSIAKTAREKGKDPVTDVEIPVAKDMADRVENILGITGVADRVRELDSKMDREEATLKLAEDFANGNVGEFQSREGKIEGAVRTAVALLTEGVVAAPIEGIDGVSIEENDDGSEFVRVFYAGPIRSAGGTAQALSVLVADYTRALLDIDTYEPREIEIERYAEEVSLYDDETGLQYTPKDDETKYITRHCPIMLDGEATGDAEVSGFRDLDRVNTNNPRGGMCLVLAEGIALKAPKIKRYTSQLEVIEWPWLDDLIDGSVTEQTDISNRSSKTVQESEATDTENTNEKNPLEPNSKYLRDLIAGRPVFSHPSQEGGFRLRYGRARNHGFATAGIHPATMHIVDDFLATGTQIKTERPGKAAGVVPVDSIEGPTVKLANGDVRTINSPEEAKEIRNGVEEILDLGEYLVNFGEFVENNQRLAPAAYTVEWWIQDLAEADADIQALKDSPYVDISDPSAEQALAWTTDFDAPLHPKFTYLWHDITVEQFKTLVDTIERGDIIDNELVLPYSAECATILEQLLVEHSQDTDITIPTWRPLVRSLGFSAELEKSWDTISQIRETHESAVQAVNDVAPFTIEQRAPTRIGARMGRPEKSKKRELQPAVHTLFPIGEAGGSQRDVSEAADFAESIHDMPGELELAVGYRQCVECDEKTYHVVCPSCSGHTRPYYECDSCEIEVSPDEQGPIICPECDQELNSVRQQTIALHDDYREALASINERETAFDILKGVEGLTSASKTPEPLQKGILRAKHDVSVFKDGTIRYDMTDLPVTSIKPDEINVNVDELRSLGYETDIYGDPLEHDSQLVELKVQDILLSTGAADHLLDTADFVDDLLTQYYNQDPYYEVDERKDLIGELVFGLAPHTSAAVVGRIVGFTNASVGYAHPYFHAAKRRNCFHPTTKIRYVNESGEDQYRDIQTFVEERLQDPRNDDFGTQITELDGDIAVPSIDEHGNIRNKQVTAVSKHPAPAHLLEISMDSGQNICVTPDHSMRRWESGHLSEIQAQSLECGDMIPTVHRPSMAAFEFAPVESQRITGDGGTISLSRVQSVDIISSDVEYTYSLTVQDTHTLIANGIFVGQCDGDEDCVMLLMDGLLNFSEQYLPDKRGGRMDAPLVMSSRIDPSEIDDEAHNIDIVSEYPREFYQATREMADPTDIDIRLAKDSVGSDDQYSGFSHSQATSHIAAGPNLSAYKTLESMQEKMDGQLNLARKIRAVNESDVAERVIEYHFLPDLIGNLRAFTRQETRCMNCGRKYRRPPLSGECRECGGDVNLTVHEGSVDKYMQTALQVADEYGVRDYTKQRLEILDLSIESLFENDKNKQSGIADFM